MWATRILTWLLGLGVAVALAAAVISPATNPSHRTTHSQGISIGPLAQ